MDTGFFDMNPLRNVSLLAALLLTGCNNSPEHGPAVGTLEWNRIEVAAQIAEPVIAWDAREGQQLSAGQPLLRLDASRARARLAAAEAARAQAAARLAEIERGTRPERLAQARATLAGNEQELRYRQREVTRLESLVARRLAAPGQLDQARTAVATTLAQRDAARAALAELEYGASAEEREQTRQTLAAAAAELQAVRIELAYTDIAAPVAGRLDELPFKVGERPPVGGVVAVILAGAKPYARVYVPEALRAQILPGHHAQVRVDGIDGELAGTVRKIAAEPSFTPYFALTEHDRGRLSFVAEVDVDTHGREVPAGVPVEVRFAVAAAQD